MEGDVDFVRQALVQSAEQGTSTRQPDAVLHDVGVEFGRRIFQGVDDGLFDACDGLLQAVRDFLVAHGHLHRHGRDLVRSVHDVVLGCVFAQVGQGGAYVDFDALGHALAHAHVVLAAHVLLDVGGKVVAGHFDGVVGHDAAQRDDGDFGRTAAYVDDHVALRLRHVDAHADSGGHRFEEQEHVASAGVFSRVAYGAQFHFRAAARYAHHHAERGREQTLAAVHHFDESAQHLFGGVEVCYHAIAQRSDDAYLVVGFLVHLFGLAAHGNHFFRVAVQGYDRRLVDYDFAAADDDGIGRSEVDGQFLCE